MIDDSERLPGQPLVRKFWMRSPDAVSIDPAEDKTHQSFRDECNINSIVRRAGLHNLPQGTREPMYGDFSEIGSLQEAYDRIDQAEADFYNLPSAVRAMTGHDPVAFQEALQDPKFVDQVSEVLGREFNPVEPTEAPTDPPAEGPSGGSEPPEEVPPGG